MLRERRFTLLLLFLMVTAVVILAVTFASPLLAGQQPDAATIAEGGGTTIIQGGTGAPGFVPVLTKLGFHAEQTGAGVSGGFQCLALAPEAPTGSHSGLFTVNAKMFFALSNVIFDASIASWAVKRAHTSERPITAIHFLKAGKPIRAWGGSCQGTQLIMGENWEPYQPATIVTPPFPEYYSGHSIFSAAGAEILKSFTGSDDFGDSITFQPGSSVVEPGCTPKQDVTLSWATFSAAADQAGISRRYGGIHFPEGDLDARAAGRRVGAQAWQKAETFFNGTATPQ